MKNILVSVVLGMVLAIMFSQTAQANILWPFGRCGDFGSVPYACCNDDCMLGETVCDGSYQYQCGDYDYGWDVDSCYEFPPNSQYEAGVTLCEYGCEGDIVGSVFVAGSPRTSDCHHDNPCKAAGFEECYEGQQRCDWDPDRQQWFSMPCKKVKYGELWCTHWDKVSLVYCDYGCATDGHCTEETCNKKQECTNYAQLRCVGSGLEHCKFDADNCGYYSGIADTTCEFGCIGGQCVTEEGEPEGLLCIGGRTACGSEMGLLDNWVYVCADNGKSWNPLKNCPVGCTSPGVCVDERINTTALICNAGETRCGIIGGGWAERTCIYDPWKEQNIWGTASKCDAGCRNNKCVDFATGGYEFWLSQNPAYDYVRGFAISETVGEMYVASGGGSADVSENLDQENWGHFETAATYKYTAQQFQAGKSGSLISVKLWLRCYLGGLPCSGTVQVFTDSTNNPSSTNITSLETVSVTSDAGPGENITINFSAFSSVTAGTKYWIVLNETRNHPFNSTNFTGRIIDDASNSYPDGLYKISPNGTGWITINAESYFQTYVRATPDEYNLSIDVYDLNGTWERNMYVNITGYEGIDGNYKDLVVDDFGHLWISYPSLTNTSRLQLLEISTSNGKVVTSTMHDLSDVGAHAGLGITSYGDYVYVMTASDGIRILHASNMTDTGRYMCTVQSMTECSGILDKEGALTMWDGNIIVMNNGDTDTFIEKYSTEGYYFSNSSLPGTDDGYYYRGMDDFMDHYLYILKVNPRYKNATGDIDEKNIDVSVHVFYDSTECETQCREGGSRCSHTKNKVLNCYEVEEGCWQYYQPGMLDIILDEDNPNVEYCRVSDGEVCVERWVNHYVIKAQCEAVDCDVRCVENERKCFPGGYRICELRTTDLLGTSCYSWSSTLYQCKIGEACVNGYCARIDQCTEDDVKCHTDLAGDEWKIWCNNVTGVNIWNPHNKTLCELGCSVRNLTATDIRVVECYNADSMLRGLQGTASELDNWLFVQFFPPGTWWGYIFALGFMMIFGALMMVRGVHPNAIMFGEGSIVIVLTLLGFFPIYLILGAIVLLGIIVYRKVSE